jgi:predicted SprT family Zn-dependent metalloprotease
MYRTLHMKRSKTVEAFTRIEYDAFQRAIDFFNAELFEGKLPQGMLTLNRKANSKGYFAPEKFSSRLGKAVTYEIALNPDVFSRRTDEEICSTLVHEMVHAWQHVHGTPSRRAYHNKEWAGKMKQVGLQPTHNGEVGGNEVGQSMTHYIIKDGPYARTYAKLQSKGFELHWQSTRFAKNVKSKNSKTKYSCASCNQNVWGAPTVKVICGECLEKTKKIVVMEAESGT